MNTSLVTQPMHASLSFHHSNLQLAYTTQAWNFNLKTCAMQANIWKCTFKCTIQVHELASPTCVLKILIDLFPLSYFSLYVKVLPICHLFTIFVYYFFPFVINDHKGSILDRLRLSMSINGVRIIFSYLVQSRTLAKDI